MIVRTARHARVAASAIRQRSSGWSSTGIRLATWAQYSKIARRSHSRGSASRPCAPSRAHSGSSWLRHTTLTESIWISDTASNTPRTWRSVG